MEKVKRSGDSVVIWCSLAMAVMVVFVLLAAAFKGGVYLAAWILIPFFFICVIAYGLVFWYKVVSNSVAARNWPMLTVQIVVTIIAAPFLLVFLLVITRVFLLSFMTLSLTVASDLPVGGGDGGQSQSSVVEEREESSPVCQ
jgi:TRAP-type C4-dicarboxylate transport system permease small subunit